MLHKSFPARFKAIDEAQGTFEALVAVFGNVDRGGDRILPGAFAATLETWKASGDPIPVIFSHQWENLDAHIGRVLEASEAADGLYVKAQLDLDEPFAAKVWRKMKARTLKEFSFAYDIVESVSVGRSEAAAPNHYQDLVALDLLEVGPCLVGMNPETQLITVKEALAGMKAGARHTAKEFAQIQEIHDLAVALGAKCAEPPQGEDTDGGGDGGAAQGPPTDGKNGAPGQAPVTPSGTPKGAKPSAYAARVALELIEAGA